jgi:hypothetical protein
MMIKKMKMKKMNKKKKKNKRKSLDLLLNNLKINIAFLMKFQKKIMNYLRMNTNLMVKLKELQQYQLKKLRREKSNKNFKKASED